MNTNNFWVWMLFLMYFSVMSKPFQGIETTSISSEKKIMYPNRSLSNARAPSKEQLLSILNFTDKRSLYPNGLSAAFDLDNYINPQTMYVISTSDTNLCDLTACDQGLATPYYVSYPDNPITFKLCICTTNPVMDLGYMGFSFSRVPLPLRQTVLAITASTNYGGDGAVAFNQTITFYGPNAPPELFVHGSAHCFDNGVKSGTAAWIQAADLDTCVPDPYSTTNAANDYAQTVVVWVYMVVSSNINNSFFACLSNTLYYVQANGLPASSISRN